LLIFEQYQRNILCNMHYKTDCLKSLFKYTVALAFILSFSISVNAQQDTSELKFDLSIPSSYNLSFINSDADRIQALIAANPTAAQALSGLAIHSFHQEFPSSHYQYLRNIYQITCANNPVNQSAILSLHSSDPVNFQYVKQMPVIAALSSYTPNDYHGTPGADCSAQLDYINAKTAWGITKGNPDIIIGINDPSGFDVNNPDLVGKIISVDNTNTPNFHGTAVAGCAAAHTDNGIGIAAIGFNCSLYLNHLGGDSVCLAMSNIGLPIINNSWLYGFDCSPTFEPANFISDEIIFDEIYENGTSTCFAAGNGLSGFGHCPSLFSYAYPGTLDHIINVGPVCYQNPLGTYADWAPNVFPPGGIPWLWKDCHEESPGNALGEFATLNYQANERVDICAPAYNVVSTYYDPHDSSAHYVSAACGTSFASPIVCGTLGLMLSANPHLSPYQLEYLLKTTARNIDYVEYPPGSGINLNAYYVGKMGAGALDAGAAVTAASTFNSNDTSTQTMYIEGIELNSICAPGYSSNGINPKFYPVIDNGTPPYTYRWDAMPENNTTLDNYTSANPTIVSGTLAQYRLGVYDHSSPVPKEASRVIQVKLTPSQTPLLTLRDSYMDMLNEPNTQANVDGYDWQLWLSPDIVNRTIDDHVFENQNPVYAPATPNYANARVRNVGCIASNGTEQLNLYWAKSGTSQQWPEDWTTATFTNPASGTISPAAGLITTSPLTVSAIQPGDEDLLSAAWFPPNPQNYDPSETSVDVGLLGRIETSTSAPYGMTFPEGTNSVTNILNNNKIASRNLIVNSSNDEALQWHQISFSNTENYQQEFSIEIGSDKQFHPSFAGDISAYMRVEVDLGDLYNRWAANGSKGTNISVDGKNKSIVYTGNGKIILKGIPLHANEKVTLRVGVILLQQPLSNQYFYIRQLLDSTGIETSIPYGNISFLIPACPNNCTLISNSNKNSLASAINVFPNPTSNILTILYAGHDENNLSFSLTDLWGQSILKQNGINVTYGSENNLQLTFLNDGVYFLRVTDKFNNSTVIKVIKA